MKGKHKKTNRKTKEKKRNTRTHTKKQQRRMKKVDEIQVLPSNLPPLKKNQQSTSPNSYSLETYKKKQYPQKKNDKTEK